MRLTTQMIRQRITAGAQENQVMVFVPYDGWNCNFVGAQDPPPNRQSRRQHLSPLRSQ